ncbi:MAG: 2OG-Fe(II) oxygenase [Candidatus Eremiobacteraeota bacterium]|nr:2OG-Fe(II) oxygenase [Candidatus Eremiobacteraeota bacterium]
MAGRVKMLPGTEGLTRDGFAVLRGALDASACDELIRGYDDDARYRSTVVMQRHNFGRGEYRYFAYPLPPLVRELRENFYAALAPIANEWNASLGLAESYPPTLDAFVAECAKAGQKRPTPLILRYEAGDFNALHQDVYGERAFPLQVTIYLSGRRSYEGGETVLAFQRPRAQSVARVLTFERGDALVFPNRMRPVEGTRGFYRENVRHGVSAVTAGERYALGLVMADAK